MSYDEAAALHALLNSTADLIYFLDAEGAYRFAAPREMPAEVRERVEAQRRDVMTSRRTVRDELTYATTEGPVTIEYRLAPVMVADEVTGVAVITRDVTERRRAKAALSASEEKFSIAFDRSPLALTITSLVDGRLVDINEGFVQMSGYTREEAIGRTPDELGLWIDPEKRAERFRLMRAGEQVPEIEARFRVKHGIEKIGVVASAVVDINGLPCVLSSVVDITERKRAEEAVRRSEAQLREFADSAPAMLWITDANGSCTFLSRGWYEFTGQTIEESLGFGWLDAVHPEDRGTARAAFAAATATPGPFSFDVRVRRADGEYRWAIDSARPRFGPDGALTGYIGSVIDISDRKRAEQAKDEFLATLSHELRTPLTSAYGWVKLLAKMRDADLLDSGLRAIDDSIVSQIRLIDDLLDVSRVAAGKMHVDMQPLDLGGVLEAAVDAVRPVAEAKGIEVRFDVAPVTTVLGDAGRLRQVFANLLSNAVKFTRRGGTVDVTLRHRGEDAEVVVRDTGEGIDAQFLPYVFDRFRQADSSISRRHGGLGIGLAIVASLVESHRGTVGAESDGIDKGSTFTVTLPRIVSSNTIRRVIDTESAGVNISGTRAVVVEDDAATRELIATTLQSAGAEVRAYATAAEGYDAIAKWRPDVVISDLAMPDEDGYSLLRRVRESGNDVPAIAITAYTRAEDESHVRAAGFRRHIPKPFDPEVLLRAVLECGNG